MRVREGCVRRWTVYRIGTRDGVLTEPRTEYPAPRAHPRLDGIPQAGEGVNGQQQATTSRRTRASTCYERRRGWLRRASTGPEQDGRARACSFTPAPSAWTSLGPLQVTGYAAGSHLSTPRASSVLASFRRQDLAAGAIVTCALVRTVLTPARSSHPYAQLNSAIHALTAAFASRTPAKRCEGQYSELNIATGSSGSSLPWPSPFPAASSPRLPRLVLDACLAWGADALQHPGFPAAP